jgi:hypothetical protein
MAFVLAGCLSNRQRWWDLCCRSFKWPAGANGSVLAGWPPASTKGHFYWLKVADPARQQKPVLAVRRNCFWHSATNTLHAETVPAYGGPATDRWIASSMRLLHPLLASVPNCRGYLLRDGAVGTSGQYCTVHVRVRLSAAKYTHVHRRSNSSSRMHDLAGYGGYWLAAMSTCPVLQSNPCQLPSYRLLCPTLATPHHQLACVMPWRYIDGDAPIHPTNNR